MRRKRTMGALWIPAVLAVTACTAPVAGGSGGETAIPSAEADVSVCVGRSQQQLDVSQPARAFGEAWNETDGAARLALLDRIWADDAVNLQPDVEQPVVGRQAFSDHIGVFQDTRPGDYFEWREWDPSYIHHDRIVMHWRICSADGAVVLQGSTFGRMGAGGRVVEATAFYVPE